jgi:hypothetical protein
MRRTRIKYLLAQLTQRIQRSREEILFAWRAAFMRQFVSLLSLCTPQKHCRDKQARFLIKMRQVKGLDKMLQVI